MNYSPDTGRSQKHALISSSCKRKQRRAQKGFHQSCIHGDTSLTTNSETQHEAHSFAEDISNFCCRQQISTVITLVMKHTPAGLISRHNTHTYMCVCYVCYKHIDKTDNSRTAVCPVCGAAL
ncbi:hypothetical protein ILYODFUR_004404 [Ilyodon furcidens]|uniref:Uncharacterized protein n=1 Tax=Ilyodon furcidens TaxID=33524 RepID=A0ABV0TT48_9TELE